MEVREGNNRMAIILLNWNGWEHTQKCIESLQACHSDQYAIIVVDNASDPAEVEKLESVSGIILIKNEKNLGFTGGNNVGLRYAYDQGFSCFMLLNNDTSVDPSFLSPIFEALKGTEVGAVQPKIYTMSDPAVIWNAGGKFNYVKAKSISIGHGQRDNGQFEQKKEIEWITGCALCMTREALDKVGYLDDQFFFMSEDVDWSLRARKIGFKLLFVPESKVYHFEGATALFKERTKEGIRSPIRVFYNRRNKLYVLRKHVKGIFFFTALIYQLSACMIHLFYFFLRRRWQKFHIIWRAMREGLRTPLKHNL